MSADFYSSRTVKARKAHKCEVCGKSIPPGARYIRKAGVHDDDFWSATECAVCQPIINEFLSSAAGEDGYCGESIEEWWSDEKCPNCKKRYPEPCKYTPDDCRCEAPDGCGDRTADGMCAAGDTCDKMTRFCWCEEYEPRYREHITNGIETAYDLAEKYLGSRDEWERIEKLNGKWMYGFWNTEGKKYKYGQLVHIPD